MLGFLKKLSPQKVFDSISSGVDKTFYTPEEQADMNKKMVETQLDFYKLTMSENSIRSYTRRIIAVSIVSVFLISFIFGVVMYKFDAKYAKFVMDSLNNNLGYSFLTIVVFYFGGAVISGLMNKSKKK